MSDETLALLEELKSIKTELCEIDQSIRHFSDHISVIETECATLDALRSDVEEIHLFSTWTKKRVSSLASRIVKAENPSCRSNLIFYGISDLPRENNEKWKQSDNKIINICQRELGIFLEPNDVKCAHRPDKHRQESARPIIAKFSYSKVKERKFKGTPIAQANIFLLGFEWPIEIYWILLRPRMLHTNWPSTG